MAGETGACGYQRIPISKIVPGEMGILLARAGAGKTACLTHLALGYLLDGESVLHVCVDLVPDKVKLWYHQLLKDIFADRIDCKLPDLERAVERRRFIMSFLNHTFSPGKLEAGIENLKQQTNFVFSLMILDGLDFGHDRALFEKIGDLARIYSVPVWLSARLHRHRPDVNERGIPFPIDAADDLFSSVLVLEQENEGVRLKALKEKGVYIPADSEFMLDPDTYLLKNPAR